MRRYIIIHGICLIITGSIDYLFDINIPSDVVNTLFSVTGIMFSVGMGLVVTPTFYDIPDKRIQNRIRETKKDIRSAFIVAFSIPTILYILDSILFRNESGYTRFSLPVMIAQILTVIFFIQENKNLQTFYDEINDEVSKCKSKNNDINA